MKCTQTHSSYLGYITATLIGLLPFSAQANDSTGYVATGGVEYIKNKNIQMYSEDLYLSPDIIRVNYEFKNLSNQDQTETILFPMPKVMLDYVSPMADAYDVTTSFKIWANGKQIKPKVHIRAFLSNGENQEDTDITAFLKGCGFNDKEIAYAWYDIDALNSASFTKKLRQCAHKNSNILYSHDPDNNWMKDEMITPLWSSQLIYSWEQTFPANSVTQVRHEYRPLLGGGVAGNVALDMDEAALNNPESNPHCFDKTFIEKVKKYRGMPYFQAFGYVLKTGANWATPIEHFKLTIDRKPEQLVSLCWDNSLKKVSPTRFEAVKTKFVPTRDINLFYVVPSE